MSCGIHEGQRGECTLCRKLHALIAADCVEDLRKRQAMRGQAMRGNRFTKARANKPTAYARHVNHVLTTRRA